MTVSFSWSTRREGNSGFVLEQSSTGQAREFGPMPCHIVPAFVEARRRLIQMRIIELEEALEDFSYMTPPLKNRQH
jgi:hypothetical protein